MDPLLQELLDKQALHDVVMRSCRGVDRLDAELLASAYHSDAYEDHGPFYQGDVQGYVPFLIEDHRRRYVATMHSILNEDYRVNGDVGYGECYLVAFLVHEQPDSTQYSVRIAAGRYIDQFERRAGEWRIARRHAIPTFVKAPLVADRPEQWTQASRDRSDITYRLLGLTS
jgi:hypothetical protein